MPESPLLCGSSEAEIQMAKVTRRSPDCAIDRKNTGWGGRIRTSEYRLQRPLPYHLATPQSEPLNSSTRHLDRQDTIPRLWKDALKDQMERRVSGDWGALHPNPIPASVSHAASSRHTRTRLAITGRSSAKPAGRRVLRRHQPGCQSRSPFGQEQRSGGTRPSWHRAQRCPPLAKQPSLSGCGSPRPEARERSALHRPPCVPLFSAGRPSPPPWGFRRWVCRIEQR